jgi:anti-sigma factor RsiW
MQQPHLLPEDIEFLLDGDQGFGSHPLRKHLESCDECRAELDRARAVNEMLESLPHVAPSRDFSARVMSRVQVFEPWHVSLVDTVQNLIPRQGPWRVVAGAAAGGIALSFSAIVVWVAMRFEFAVGAGQLGWSKLQAVTSSVAGTAVSGMFGESALSTIRNGGTPAIIIGALALVATLAVATIGLRGLFAAARRRGN